MTATETRLDRRQLVARAGALAALGSLWTPVTAPARARDRGKGHGALFDVACLGDTFAPNFDEALDAANGDMRGAGFFVEGTLYPAGTIPAGDGFDPDSAEATGLWLCRGWFMFHPGRPLPHVVTTQEYMLGEVSGERPSPADQLVSSGLEGGVRRTVRSVMGGTGRYRHARGELVQQVIGTNTTVLNEVGEQAPNFRFALRR